LQAPTGKRSGGAPEDILDEYPYEERNVAVPFKYFKMKRPPLLGYGAANAT
jgi:hypothetical protein